MLRLTLFLLIVVALLPCSSCNIVRENQLQSAVVKALAKDPRTKDFKFEVSVQEEGHIVITGEVYQQQDIEAVSEVAKLVPGVKQVTNNCKLEEQGSDMLQDTTVGSFGL